MVPPNPLRKHAVPLVVTPSRSRKSPSSCAPFIADPDPKIDRAIVSHIGSSCPEQIVHCGDTADQERHSQLVAQDQGAAVRCREVDVEHLDGGELVEHGPRREAGASGLRRAPSVMCRQ